MTHHTSTTHLDRTLRTACAAFASLGLILAAVGCGSAGQDAVQSRGLRPTYSYEHDSHIVETRGVDASSSHDSHIVETSAVTHDASVDHDSHING